jgi:thioredoxin 1
MSELPEFTTASFSSEVIDADRPVIVKVWGPGCAACRAVRPVVTDLASTLGNRVKVGFLNIREHTDLAASYGVDVVPTLLVFKNGTLDARLVGARKIQAFAERIEHVVHGRTEATGRHALPDVDETPVSGDEGTADEGATPTGEDAGRASRAAASGVTISGAGAEGTPASAARR